MRGINFKLSDEFENILRLSWPVMIATILQSLLGTVDMKFISMISNGEKAAEPAAASLGNSTAGVVFVFCTLISAGTVALISRSYGEGNNKSIKKTAGSSVLLAIFIGLILGILCMINTKSIIKIMYNPNNSVLNLTVDYLRIIFIGTVFVFLNFTIRTILQALGDTRTPLYIFGLGNIINLILDPIMIFNMHLGIKGAAIATVISNFISFILIVYILIKNVYGKSIMKFFRYLKFDITNSIRILRIGLWACLQQITRPITGMLMFRIVNGVGEEQATAAFGFGGQLFNYTFIFLSGLTVAISIIVGQSIGKKDLKSAELIISDGLKLAVINMMIFSIVYLIFPQYIIGIFTKNPEVISIGVNYLRIVYIGLVFVVFSTVYGGTFQGAGDTFPPMISSIIANVVVKLPLAYILAIPLKIGVNGVWIAISISVVVEAFIIIIFFRRGTWKRKEI